MKKAFTMLELVIVIVLLGILASIGSEIFAKTFDNYVKTRSMQNLEIQSQIVTEQVAKRLSYRVDYTMAAYDGAVKAIEDAGEDGVDLIWLSRDYEPNRIKKGSSNNKVPYSGFAYCAMTSGKCDSPNSSFSGYSSKTAFVLFNSLSWYKGTGDEIKAAYYEGKQPACGSSDCVTFRNENMTISGWKTNDFPSAPTYQIAKHINRITYYYKKNEDDATKTIKNLYLFTCNVDNFSNCTTNAYDKNTGKCTDDKHCHLLAKNVSDFKFKNLSSSCGGGSYGIEIKVCVEDPLFTTTSGEPYAVCKTQVVE